MGGGTRERGKARWEGGRSKRPGERRSCSSAALPPLGEPAPAAICNRPAMPVPPDKPSPSNQPGHASGSCNGMPLAACLPPSHPPHPSTHHTWWMTAASPMQKIVPLVPFTLRWWSTTRPVREFWTSSSPRCSCSLRARTWGVGQDWGDGDGVRARSVHGVRTESCSERAQFWAVCERVVCELRAG